MASRPEDVEKAETAEVDAAELRARAMSGATWWLDASRHERDEASGVWLARFARWNEWKPIAEAPQDGTDVLVTDGQHVWIGSQRIGRHAGPSRNGQPTSGHLFAWRHDKPPTHWTWLPIVPNVQ